MKKLRMSLLATVVAATMFIGSSALMADSLPKCDSAIVKSDPYGFSPKVVAVADKQLLLSTVAVEPQIGLNKIDRKYAKLIEWGDSPALMAEHKGNLGENDTSTMKFANLNRNTTIYVSSIGGSGGAPMFQTGASISDSGSI